MKWSLIPLLAFALAFIPRLAFGVDGDVLVRIGADVPIGDGERAAGGKGFKASPSLPAAPAGQAAT